MRACQLRETGGEFDQLYLYDGVGGRRPSLWRYKERLCARSPGLNIKLPLEFKNLCKQDGVSPREVLEGFIRDLCALDGSHGSDERDKAQAYYDRCGYPYLNDR